MQTGWKSGCVGIPVQDIEGRRLVAEQVVVDPVIPDQVVRPHPREHRASSWPSTIPRSREASLAARIVSGVIRQPNALSSAVFGSSRQTASTIFLIFCCPALPSVAK